MNGLIETREKLMELYAQYSKIIDKVINFVLALVTFMMINSNLGFMKTLSNPMIPLVLAVVCAFLPKLMTVLVAVGMVLAHLFSLSLGVLIVIAIMAVIMLIFYFSFTPKKAVLLLVTPICYALHVPFLVPVACGLCGTPVNMIPIAFGSIAYYAIEYIKANATALGATGADGMIAQLTTVSKTILTNKEMWVSILAMAVCVTLVYAIRRNSMDQAWKIGTVVGTVMGVITLIMGSTMTGGKIAFMTTVLGAVVAIALGMLLELFIFSVDYSRTEKLQFEDDEYYYYVKAVPKVSIATQEKVVKRIGDREESDSRRNHTGHSNERNASASVRGRKNRNASQRSTSKNQAVRKTEHMTMGQTDELLLSKSLQKELDLKN